MRPLRDRGFALLIVLWTMALLSLLISQLSGSGRQAMRLAGNLRTQAALQAAADGAVLEAGFHAAAAGAAHWPADGVVHLLHQGATEIRVRIVNEAGRINPSVASLELVTALVHGCGLEPKRAIAVASAIVAWRFPSAQTSYGADAYRDAGRSYAPPGQPFESIAELGLVLGVTPELLACLAPHLSLYRDGDPDPNAADAAVSRALAEVLGAPPQRSDAPADESVLHIEVAASGADGAHVAREATLRLEGQGSGTTPEDGGNASVPFRVLGWSR